MGSIDHSTGGEVDAAIQGKVDSQVRVDYTPCDLIANVADLANIECKNVKELPTWVNHWFL